jgi:hypothetical protein
MWALAVPNSKARIVDAVGSTQSDPRMYSRTTSPRIIAALPSPGPRRTNAGRSLGSAVPRASALMCLTSRVRREDPHQARGLGSQTGVGIRNWSDAAAIHAGPLAGANTAAQRQVRRSGTPQAMISTGLRGKIRALPWCAICHPQSEARARSPGRGCRALVGPGWLLTPQIRVSGNCSSASTCLALRSSSAPSARCRAH